MAKLALALLAALPLAGAGPVTPQPAPQVAPQRAAELEHMVRQDCGSCHGLRLTGGLGRPITAAALAGRDARELGRVILDGLPGTAMPGWRPLLTEDEAHWIAEYLLTRTE